MKNLWNRPITVGSIVILTGVSLVGLAMEFAWFTDMPGKIKSKFSKKDETENNDSSDERTEDEEA